MVGWTLALAAVLASAGSDTPSSPEEAPAVDLMLLSSSPFVELSNQWATLYSLSPILVAMPVTTETSDETEESDDDGSSELSWLPRPFSTWDIGYIALDWGLAHIGPGVLFPQPPFGSNRPGRRGGGGGGGGSGGGGGPGPGIVMITGLGDPFPDPPGGDPPTNDPDPPPENDPPTHSPEPSSLALWGLATGVAGLYTRRRRRRSAKRAL